MRNWTIRCGIATFMVWAAMGHGAYACDQRIIEPFVLTQSNGFEVDVGFYSQWGFLVGGRASYYSAPNKISGQIANGKLTGDHLHFLVVWENGSAGIYDADIDSAGRLVNGQTYDRDHPSSRASWSTNVTMQCCVTEAASMCASGKACGAFCVGRIPGGEAVGAPDRPS